MSDCHPSTEFPARKKGFPSVFVFQWQDGPPQTGTGLLKNGWRDCLYGAFLRPGGRFFAVKTELLSAKKRTAFRKDETFLPQGSPCGCRKRGKTGLRKAFLLLDGVRPRANPVCPFVSHSPRGADARGEFRPHGVPWRAAKCRGNRLSAFILHPLGRVRFAHFRSVSAPRRLRGSRRGCLDVLTKCHLGTYCPPQAFWRLRDRRRPAPPKHAREFPRAVFLPISESLKYTAGPTGFLLSRNPFTSDEKTIFLHGRNLPNINGWVAKKRWRADFLVRGMSKSYFFI